MSKKILPLGIENFEKMIQEDYYYIDKTGLITELLKNQSEVTLFTRPRRFGKSLNMSMLKSFFLFMANTKYEEELRDEGMERILKYGIACYKKRCKVSVI